MSETMICVGAIGGAFGVAGEVRLKSFCAEPTDIASYGTLLGEDGREFAITLTRPLKGALGARLPGVSTKEQADALKGTRLYVPRERLPDLPDDEFYHSDLIGLEVVDTGGAILGDVLAVHDHGAGDLLEVRLKGGNDTIYLPFTRAVVPTVDLAAGRIVADPPEEA